MVGGANPFGRREFLKHSGATLSASFTSARARTGGSSPPPARTPATDLRTGLVFSGDYKKHLAGLGHPESPQRLDAVMGALAPKQLGIELTRLAPRTATRPTMRRPGR